MEPIVFIGGGNMARAIVGGLVQSGRPAASIHVVDPDPDQRQRVSTQFGVATHADPAGCLAPAGTVVWAVKPQYFAPAAAACVGQVSGALHLSVMAGIRSRSIAQAVRAERIVRAMPNTPALIGQGIAGLYARPAVAPSDRDSVQALLAPTGQCLWVEHESDLDAVTALSGSGPAYVFYVVEALVRAARDMGLSEAQGRRLALATFSGATALALASPDSPQQLRAQVTSKGGTTQAAVAELDARAVQDAFVHAVRQAQRRARELGDEFDA
jgi:pyrroline-5-carboxylate reductase